MTTMAELHELHFDLLVYPPYSPDLAPCSYYVFTDLKKTLQWKRFGTIEQVTAGTEAHFEAKDKLLYKKDIAMLEKRWCECITL